MQTDRLQVKGINNVLYADQFSGSDIGAKVNAAVAYLAGAGIICIPVGNYTYTTDIVLGTYQSLTSSDAAQQATNLTYNGTGNAITTVGGNTISGISLTLGTSAAKGFLLKGENIRLQNCWMAGGGASTKLIHVTQFNGITLSGLHWISHVVCNSFNGTAVTVDHCTGTHFDNVYFQATGANTTGVVIDSGVSDIEMNNCAFLSNTLGGMIIKNSLGGGANSFDQYPTYLNFHQTIIDSANQSPGRDAILFDSTLGTSPVYIRFVDSWAAGHGNNGLHISGGQGISWLGGIIRANGLNGVRIDSANVSNVLIANSFITGNNTSNNGDAHGFYLTAACLNISLIGNVMGNILDTTGHQIYGWKTAAVAAIDFKAIGNNVERNGPGNANSFQNNIVGGTYTILDSDGSVAGTPNWIFGDLHLHGSLFMDANAFGQTLQVNNAIVIAAAPTVSAGQVGIGSTHATTVGAAGGATALPATPLGYLIANVDGTQVKIPYYNN